jgi:hypothetical protein
MLPVASSGCKTFLTLRKDHRLRVFNKWVLRKILRSKQKK